VEEPRARACGGDKPVVVFDGLGVVYPVRLCQNQTANHTVVSLQELSEFPGCAGRIAKLFGNHTVPARITEFLIDALAPAA